MARKQPEFFATEQAAFDNADAVVLTRSRPVMAQDPESNQFIVCCGTTARKYGWEILGKLYARNLNRAGRTATAETKAETPVVAPQGAALDPVEAPAKAVWPHEYKPAKASKKRTARKEALKAVDAEKAAQ